MIDTLRISNTDLGNARRIALLHGGDLRYVHIWKKWICFDGRRWAVDKSGEVIRRAKDTVMSMYAEASQLQNDTERKELIDHARKCESAARIGAMVDLSQSELPADPEQLDGENTEWYLNCLNGVVDLKTGRLFPHSEVKEHFITKLAPAVYDSSAKCPQWLEFLGVIMEGNQDLVYYLQKLLGYSLTADISEQKFFIMHGCGANGKSTLLNVIARIMGDYATVCPINTLLVKQDTGGASSDIARLKGARLVTSSESDEGRRLSEAIIKQLTGGDKVTARFLFGEFFEFKPVLKLILCTNHKPEIRGIDHAIWRRVQLIPFNVKIDESQQDKDLPEKLWQEASGILNWLIEGCKAWQREGLGQPAEIQAATSEYRDENDIVEQFLNENVEFVAIKDVKIKCGTMYKMFTDWCRDTGNHFDISQIAFSRRLQEKGLEKNEKKGRDGYFWLGVRPAKEQEDKKAFYKEAF